MSIYIPMCIGTCISADVHHNSPYGCVLALHFVPQQLGLRSGCAAHWPKLSPMIGTAPCAVQLCATIRLYIGTLAFAPAPETAAFTSGGAGGSKRRWHGGVPVLHPELAVMACEGGMFTWREGGKEGEGQGSRCPAVGQWACCHSTHTQQKPMGHLLVPGWTGEAAYTASPC